MDASCDFYPIRPDGALYDNAWHTPILGQYYTDKPNTFIDISDFFEKKLEALRCHKSQNPEGELFPLVEVLNAYEKDGKTIPVEPMKLLSNFHLHCFTSKVGSNSLV